MSELTPEQVSELAAALPMAYLGSARPDAHQRAADALAPVVARMVAEAKADAWDEGEHAGYMFERGEVYPEPSNPYRAEAEAPDA